MKHKFLSKLLSGVIVLAGCAGFAFLHTNYAHAAPLTFQVNSGGNGVDANVGNGACETATPGQCTLYAAIQEANANSGPDTIEFDFLGTGIHVITTTGYPAITSPVTINGYSQDGSTENTTTSPDPIDAHPTIDIHSSNQGGTLFDIRSGGSGTTLRGLVVSSSTGTILTMKDANNITVQGNFFSIAPDGTTADVGTARMPLLDNSPGFTSTGLLIGGSDPEDRNLLYSESDIFQTDGTTISGNYYGIDKNGTSSVGIGSTVSAIYASENDNLTIGGSTTAEGNVIAGNTNSGGGSVNVLDTDNLDLSNNKVGVDYTGSSAITTATAVGISSTTNATIDGNTMSGSNNYGIGISQNSSGFILTNNMVGVSSDGTSALGNAIDGIHVSDSSDVTIGTSGNGNTVSGNSANGIKFENTSDSTINSNTIGTDSSGMVTLGNGDVGIVLMGGSSNSSVTQNVISDNGSHGILLDSATDNDIQDNIIGLSSDLSLDLSNAVDGIHITNSSSNNLIGGLSSTGNYIHNNGGTGVTVEDDGSVGNSIVSNSIYNNTGRGINLGDGSQVANDANDPDPGPNNLLNFPTDVTYEETGGNTKMRYALDVPAGNYRVEYFSNTTDNGNGDYQGEVLVGSQEITSAGSGSQNFTYTSLTGINIPNITMTVTEEVGNATTFGDSSEFSDIATAYVPPTPVQDIGITKEIVDPDNVSVGDNIQYDFTYTNHGPDDIDLTDSDGSSVGQNNLFLDILPPNLTFVSTDSPGTVSCYSAGPGSAAFFGSALQEHDEYAVVFCDYTDSTTHILHANESITVRFTASVDSNPTGNFTNYALVSSNVYNDPDQAAIAAAFGTGNDVLDIFTEDPINNFSNAQFPLPATDIETTKVLTDPQDVGPNTIITYNFGVKNNGPGDFDIGTMDGTQGFNQMMTDVLPPGLLPQDMDNAGNIDVGNPDIACQYLGPDSASYGGALLANHSNYGLINCVYSGGSHVLNAGEGVDFSMSFQLSASPPTTFANYVFTVPPATDPDYDAFIAAYMSGDDIISYYEANPVPNNFDVARYTANSPSGGGGNVTVIVGALAATGEALRKYWVYAVGLLFIGSGSILIVVHQKRRKQ